MGERLELAGRIDLYLVAGIELEIKLSDNILPYHNLTVLKEIFDSCTLTVGHDGKEEVEKLVWKILVYSI